MPARYVMDQVGHADSRMTTGVYMKVMRRDPGQKAALRAVVDGGVWDALGRESDSDAHAARPFERSKDAKTPPERGFPKMGAAGFEPATSRV